MEQIVPVAIVGGEVYEGSKLEAIAARLKPGDKVIFDGSEHTVEYVYFFEGPSIKLVGGRTILPALGDDFELPR